MIKGPGLEEEGEGRGSTVSDQEAGALRKNGRGGGPL